MSKAEKIIGQLTLEETEQVLREAVFALAEDRLIAVLSEVLTLGQADEIVAAIAP